jgi:hypothetical protein
LSSFQPYSHSERKGENYPKDIQQLNALYSDWLVRLCNDKVFDEALFAAWLYLKLKQYALLIYISFIVTVKLVSRYEDRRVRTIKGVEQDKLFLKYMIDSVTNGAFLVLGK